MKLEVFSVRDTAVGAFLPPFFTRSRGEAIRSFEDAVEDPSRFGKHRQHFELVHLASFDDESGEFTSVGPVRIVGGLDFVFGPEPTGSSDT